MAGDYAYAGRDSGPIGPILFTLAVVGVVGGGIVLLNSSNPQAPRAFQAGLAGDTALPSGSLPFEGSASASPSAASEISFSPPKLPSSVEIEVSEVEPQTMAEYPLAYSGKPGDCGIPLVSVNGDVSRFVTAEIYYDDFSKSYFLLLKSDVSNENLSKDYLLAFENKTGSVNASFSRCPKIQESALTLQVKHEKPEVIGLDTLPECEEQLGVPSASPSPSPSSQNLSQSIPPEELSLSQLQDSLKDAPLSYAPGDLRDFLSPNPLPNKIPQVRQDPLDIFKSFAGAVYKSACIQDGSRVVEKARKYVYNKPKNFLDIKPPAGKYANKIPKGKTCAWFVTNVYQDAGFGSIYGLRARAQDLKDLRPAKSKVLRNINDLLPGDIVLMHTYDRKDGLDITHVGIYSGKGMMIHSRLMGVVEEPVFTFINQDLGKRAYYGAVRVLPSCNA